ncbi:MAG: 4Fe-4S dicluster domain-containing protein [Saprospiraceae bacterium]|nr:4Fe-4S dicluster domain-containing protein [Saprospiraceae bacterium]
MKDRNAGIWIGDKDLNQDLAYIQQADTQSRIRPDETPTEPEQESGLQSNRRDFLRFMGFSVGAATLAASCKTPVRKALPYLIKPDTIVPGIANYYASSYVDGGDYCGILVKTREGRPIKIEGNPLSPVTHGGTSAKVQALVLSLYDTHRIQGPMVKGEQKWESSSWNNLDDKLTGLLTPASKIRIISNTILSPTSKKAIADFKSKFPNTESIAYDPISSAAILLANESSFGLKVIPSYYFDKAKTIVSINADFLGTWISPIEYAKQYIVNRKIDEVSGAKMSRHFQVESYMSLSGSNADNRILIKPSEQGASIAFLYNALAAKSGAPSVAAPSIPEKTAGALAKIADQLLAQKGASLVVSGSNVKDEQILVNKINEILGNYGITIDLSLPSYQRQGNEADLVKLVGDMEGGLVDAIILFDLANPAYDYPALQKFQEAFAKVKTRISFSGTLNETTNLCNYIAPAHHLLESWGDAEPKEGILSLIQPTISPLFNTRQGELSLLKWAATDSVNWKSDSPYYEYLKSNWTQHYLNGTSWDKALHDGVFYYPWTSGVVPKPAEVSVASLKITQPLTSGTEITFFESVNIGAGQHANNPWLQEMPDPVTRCVWGNYLAVPVAFNGVNKFIGAYDLENGDHVNLAIGATTLELPAIQQFGQLEDTLAIALGYGRSVAGPAGINIGTNVFSFCQQTDGLTQYYNTVTTSPSKSGKTEKLATVQYHHTMGVEDLDKKTGQKINADEAATVFFTYFGLAKQGFQGSLVDRSVIRRSNLSELDAFASALKAERKEFQHLNDQTLYPDYSEIYAKGHQWHMHIDLNACIGCGACAVACMAENNVPVVGKYEVSRHHEMSWLRVDRYYYGDAKNPNVVFQPLMCQHCHNAPCENVCPVNATNHNSEGINQMVYNRCVGTRYCANNCPYKVRRFNWLDYTKADLWPINEPAVVEGEETPFMSDNLTRMVLNPDVTVRARGVIEKCSFCTQRIQEGKLTAKKEGRMLVDSDVMTACQTACPTGAITFGDINNKDSKVYHKHSDPLNYQALEEVNTRPSVTYKSRIVNRDESIEV